MLDERQKSLARRDVIMIGAKELGEKIFNEGAKKENSSTNEFDAEYAGELVTAYAERLRERISFMVSGTIQTHYHCLKGQSKKSILRDINQNVKNFEI